MKHFYRLVIGLAALCAGIYSVTTVAAQEKERATEKQGQAKQEKPADKAVEPAAILTLQGQVIDLACFLANAGALAGDHQACAEACVKGGATLGFQTPDRSYVVLRDPMHQKDAPDLSGHVNKKAEITAKLFMRDGFQGIQILSIR